MTKTCVGVLLTFGFLGCNSNSPPGATVAMDVTLDDSALVGMQKVSLIRTGDSFMLAGYENGRIGWGSLSLDGKVTHETDFNLTLPLVGPAPVFAATKKDVPGDEFVALVITNSATMSGRYDLQAIVQTLSDPAPAAPVLLYTLPVGTDPTTIQIVAGAETTGNLGFVAWGVPGFSIGVYYRLIPADPTLATTSQLSDYLDWQCLTAANSTTGLSFGVVNPLTDAAHSFDFSNFNTVGIDETGGTAGMTYPLTTKVANCRVVGSPTPEGDYFIAFQSSNAIGFTTYHPDSADPTTGTLTPEDLALPAAIFGGPLNTPSPAWVTSAGVDVSIGVSRTAGPQVFRFVYNGVPHGGTLTLHSAKGQTGPVAASVASDAVFVTYADQVDGSPSVKRYFMSIASPATLP